MHVVFERRFGCDASTVHRRHPRRCFEGPSAMLRGCFEGGSVRLRTGIGGAAELSVQLFAMCVKALPQTYIRA